MRQPRRIRGAVVGVALAMVCGDARGAEDVPEDSQLYAAALQAALEAENGLFETIGQEMESEILVIGETTSITEGLAGQSGRFRVSVVNEDHLRGRFRKENKPLPVFKLFQARLENGRLVVGLNRYWFRYEKKLFGRPTYTWSLEGGVNVLFEYDCERGRYVIIDAETWGV